MTVFDHGVSLYRRTLKRVKPLHRAIHGMMTRTLIPYLEARRNFRTMPDDPFWFRVELLTDNHEVETTAQLEKLVTSGMVALDVGAHVGYYTRRISKLVGPGGRVVAFEPHPRNHRLLKHNVGKLRNVTLQDVALTEQEGTAQLYDYLMMSASGSLHYDESMRDVQQQQRDQADYAPRLETDFQPQKFDVRTAPGDDILRMLGIEQIDFIKMDIEGAEIDALRGLQQTIQQSPHLHLIMEYNPLGLRAFGHDPATAIEEVLDMGFDTVEVVEGDGTLRDITEDAEALDTLTADLVTHMGVVNLLFTR